MKLLSESELRRSPKSERKKRRRLEREKEKPKKRLRLQRLMMKTHAKVVVATMTVIMRKHRELGLAVTIEIVGDGTIMDVGAS